jgi:hypothetical protein
VVETVHTRQSLITAIRSPSTSRVRVERFSARYYEPLAAG